MKKIYLSMVAVVTVSSLYAQQLQKHDYAPAPKHSSFKIDGKINPAEATSKVQLWSNDCSVAADFTVSNTSSPAVDFILTTDPAAVPANGPVQMTTSANGYYMVDGDSQGANGTQDCYLTYVGTAVDLSGQTDVTLEFEHNYRVWNDQRYVEVSVDGGTTWGTPYQIGSTVNSFETDETYSINISGQAANQANVKLRFHYVAVYGWHWAIDDLSIKTTEPFDLRADDVQWGVDGTWGVRMAYYGTPLTQVQPITFCGTGSNIGANDITDATFTANVASEGFSGTSAAIALAVAEMDTMCLSTTHTPTSAIASHTADFNISTAASTDNDLTNNDYSDVVFEITDYIYARDNMPDGAQGGTFNQGDGFEAGNIFDMFTAETLYGIQVEIAATSVEGASIFGKLYSIDATTGDFILEDQTDYYTLLAADLGATLDLGLLSGGFPLNADDSYLIVVGSDGDGGSTNDLVVANSGTSPEQTTFYYDATDLTWYFTTSTSNVRMVLSSAPDFVTVQDLSNNIDLNIFPNPATNNTTVSFSLTNEADVAITVTELTGKVVSTNNVNAVVGTNEVSINTSSMANGVYIVNVVANGVVSTQKLVVRK